MNTEKTPSVASKSYYTVAQFAERNPAFTGPAMRNLIFKADPQDLPSGETAPGNGLLEAGAILRLGRKVLVNEDRFFEWLESSRK